MLRNKGQQEMVGFILIVVVVMIGLMVFLVISLRTFETETNNPAVDDMLSAIMTHTTECVIPVKPYYKTFEDLFLHCFENSECSGVDKPACEYLNESLRPLLEDLVATDATISAYQFDYSVLDEEGQEGILRIEEGECKGEVLGAQRKIDAGAEDIIIRLRVCKSLS